MQQMFYWHIILFHGTLVIDKLSEQKIKILRNIYKMSRQVYGKETVSRKQDLCQVGNFNMEVISYK